MERTTAVRVFAAALALCLAVPAAATDSADVVDWYYAPSFGSGVYQIGGKQAAVVTIPILAQLTELGPSSWPLRLRMPVTLGIYQSDLDKALEEFRLPETIGMASVLPGLEIDVPLRGLRLRPFVGAGVGVEFQDGGVAGLWNAGLLLLRRWPVGQFDLGIGFEVTNAGYWTRGSTEILTRTGVGFDAVVDPGLQLFSRNLLLGSYFSYRYYTNDLDVILADRPAKSIRHEMEFALTFGLDPAPRLLGLELSRLGLGFRFGSGLRGLRLVTRFPF